MMKRIERRRMRKPEKDRKLRMEPLEARLCMAASVGWDGPGLGAASLSYYIGNVPAGVGLGQAEVETAIETALDAWAQVADLTFTQTTLARRSDSLDITFSSIDGSGGILAQAYLPDDVNRGRLAGDIEFDLADPWEVGGGNGSTAFDLIYVAVHEIGHALGLDHLNVVGSVMRPSVSPSQVFTGLATADVNEILGVYAAAPSDLGSTESGSTDAAGGNETTDQGGDTNDDSSPADDNTSDDDETMVDDGPLEEEHAGCHGGSRDPFARFDANEDGFLTVHEVPERLWERLLVADSDEDGAISPAELEAIAGEHHRGDQFASFDTNEDGALTVDEVPERLWKRLSQADADEDGAVTVDELAEARSDLGVHSHHRPGHGGRLGLHHR